MKTNTFNHKIALGAWAWGSGTAGGDQIFGNSLTMGDLKPVFERAIQHDLTLWDTAAVYGMGASEEILGTFIKDCQRESLVISTKFTPQIAANSEHPAKIMLEESMGRLHIDYVDIYWIHNNSDVKKWTTEIISLAKSGKIKHIGVSNHNLEEIKLANSILSEEGLRISAVQNHFSLMHRVSEENGVMDYCKNNDIIFFAYMVLEQGALSGKYNSHNLFPKNSARAESYNFHLPKIEKLTKVIEEIAVNYKASIAQISIAWAIAKGSLPIIGVTKVEQVDDAALASKIELSESDIALIENTANELGISTIRDWEK